MKKLCWILSAFIQTYVLVSAKVASVSHVKESPSLQKSVFHGVQAVPPMQKSAMHSVSPVMLHHVKKPETRVSPVHSEKRPIDHVKHGAVGYAKYALEHPLKDRLVCTDTSRKKGKYKDSDGNIVTDPEMTSITKKLFLAIKDRNSELITEYANDLKVKLDSFGSDNNEMTNEETVEINGITDDLIDLVTSVFSQKRQSNEISDGLKPELFHQFVKEISSGSYRSN